MTYLEKLLADRETVIIKAHRHILFVILHMIPYVLLSLLLWTLSGIVQVYMTTISPAETRSPTRTATCFTTPADLASIDVVLSG